MNARKWKSPLLVLAGIVIGCSAATVGPEFVTIDVAFAKAQKHRKPVEPRKPGKSGWECYLANGFDEKSHGRNSRGARKAEDGLNALLPDAESGMTMIFPPESGGGYRVLGGVFCMKR